MKKIIIILFLIILFTPNTFAQSSSFKTFTPTQPYYGYNYNGRYLPPPPNYSANQKNKYWKRRNHYNSYYNPYYSQPAKSIITNIGDFFSSGKMTGYTDSNFDDIDIPYGYEEGYQDDNGNYYKKNYGYQNGASIKILD